MDLLRRVVLATVAAAAIAHPAAADSTQLGAWVGPRVFSDDSRLGYIENAPAHPSLEAAIQFGLRVSHPFLPWLVPELELGFSPAKTTPTGTDPVSVYWLEPRLQLRFELLPGRRIQPFLLLGGGSPISLSTATKTFATSIIGDGYAGAGLRLDTGKGFAFRLDARLAVLPDQDRSVTTEIEVGAGVEIALGRRRAIEGHKRIATAPVADRDRDGIPDDKDACPDRPEDEDGFDDLDGCPDIDNDLDRVLDIADKCPGVPETYNGFQDDDGCPDTLPPEVDGLRGTIEGLIYAEGETLVRDSAQKSIDKIAKIMITHPSIRVVLIGHTDDHEAQQFATEVEGEAPPDLAALSSDLSRARAEAVRQALSAAGIAAPRIDVEGHGSEEPVSENDKPRGRLANRRVEIMLYVPPSGR